MADLLDPDAMPGVLATLFATRHNRPDLVAGVNDDDCAVLRFARPLLVVTTDYVNANPISIEFGLGSVATIGRLAVAANLADLLGTGALPRCFLLSVVMPRDCETGTFRLLADGCGPRRAGGGFRSSGETPSSAGRWRCAGSLSERRHPRPSCF